MTQKYNKQKKSNIKWMGRIAFMISGKVLRPLSTPSHKNTKQITRTSLSTMKQI
jgi:hypothetical protein